MAGKPCKDSVILERLDSLKTLFEERFEGIHKRLDILNHQTEKNTKARYMQYVINTILGVVGGATVVGLVGIAIKAIYGK